MKDLLDILASADFAKFAALVLGIGIVGGIVGALSARYFERRISRARRNRQPRYLFK